MKDVLEAELNKLTPDLIGKLKNFLAKSAVFLTEKLKMAVYNRAVHYSPFFWNVLPSRFLDFCDTAFEF